MARFAARTGRQYGVFEYSGDPEADRVLVIMGSAAGTAQETVASLAARGEQVGVLTVRLFRPFSGAAFVHALPRSVRALAVLDRTKEPGALGEPLYQDVVTALAEARVEGSFPFAVDLAVVGGRYGLSSKEFTPAMVKAVFDNLAHPRPKNHFTVGIVDDVTHTSLRYDEAFEIQPADVATAVFYGLGADGTVGSNKNSIRILGAETDRQVQGYFVYDSKRAGATTVSHLRTSPRPIRSAYLIQNARFVACHQFEFLDRIDVLEHAQDGAVFLLNAPGGADGIWIWERLPREVQQQLIDRHLRFYVIDASAVAQQAGLGGRINTIMQTSFFCDLRRAAARRGHRADRTRDRQDLSQTWAGSRDAQLGGGGCDIGPLTGRGRSDGSDRHARASSGRLRRGPRFRPARHGDARGRQRRSVAGERVSSRWHVARGDGEAGDTQPRARDSRVRSGHLTCNQCVPVCPHATIRAKVYDADQLAAAPPTFTSTPYKGLEFRGRQYTIQVAPQDCTGCALCANVCPAKDRTNPRHKAIDMRPRHLCARPNARTMRSSSTCRTRPH